MTEQEAEAFLRRATKIWVPYPYALGAQWERMSDGSFHLNVAEDTFVALYPGNQKLYLSYQKPLQALLYGNYCTLECVSGQVECNWIGEPEDLTEEEESLLPVFAHRWSSYFRRGLWLSGIDIEASAHEKAEWMQGFTHEELQTWDLKM